MLLEDTLAAVEEWLRDESRDEALKVIEEYGRQQRKEEVLNNEK